MIASTVRLLVALLALGSTLPAAAAGLLAPRDESLPPLRITDHLVDVGIKHGIALTTVTQTFHNDTSRRLEATYVFPLPEEADLTNFEMTFNGKMVEGRVLPADEAARIYESIVRQAKDPGLIEFIGRRLLQMRVFPIEPGSDTTIRVRYQQICRPVSGMKAYHYPLRTRTSSGQAYGTVRFSVALEVAAPLKNIWSPTHAVEIIRAGNERHASIAYEASGGSLEDDFLLLYDTDESDLGLSVVAHKTRSDEPGHFVLMMTPKQLWPEEKKTPQDVVFVVDTSGSMAGDKITQARKALAYCIDRLDEDDRFGVVRFSTGFDALFDELRPATADNRAEARKWIEQFSAAGGTNIADTLQHVVAMRPRGDRPFITVFLTDGRGNREADEIMNLLADQPDVAIRVFPFGVGHDVNTKLLDRLSDAYAGRTTYVQPGENLEMVLGDFFSVISRPVLTDLRLTLPAIGTTERFPATLGDLYHGQQVIVAGCFREEAMGTVRLTARRGDESVEYVWPDVSFRSEPTAGYVPTVWAGRKIAFLVDQVRRHGESTEMIEEILVLSQQYGIQTPYSSWLVDPERTVERGLALIPRTPGFSSGGRGTAGQKRRPPGAGASDLALRRAGGEAIADQLGQVPAAARYGDEAGEIDLFLAGKLVTAESGEAANIIARKNAELRELRTRDEGRLSRRNLAHQKWGDRGYNRIGQFLVDESVDADTEIVLVRFASTAYFDLVRARPELRSVMAASQLVVVRVTEGAAILVSDRVGQEEFSDEERQHLRLTLR